MTGFDIWIGGKNLDTLDWRTAGVVADEKEGEDFVNATDGTLNMLGFDPFKTDEDTASTDGLYYLQPDGSYSKGDGRSQGVKREDIPADAKISDTARVGDYHLYHITGAHKALAIIAKQELRLPLAETNNSELQSAGAPKLFYMSFARTLTSGYIGDRGHGNTMGDPVLLIFNRQKLAHIPRTTIKPVDYWGNSDEKGRQLGRAKEAEERLFSDRPTISVKGMIEEVRLMVAKDDYRDRRLKEVLTICKQLKIPVKLFNIKDIQGFMHGRENSVERKELFDWLKTQKAPEIWSSGSDALKASIVRKKLPGKGYDPSSMQRLKEFVHKSRVGELSDRAKRELTMNIFRYDRGLNPFKDYYVSSAELHNMRAGRAEERERFHQMLVDAKVKNIDQFFKRLSDKWRAAIEEYNAEYNDAMDRKYKTGKYAEAASYDDTAATGFVGDVQRTGTLAGIKYDQRNGLGNVPNNANLNYMGFAVIMEAGTFLRCVPPRHDDIEPGADKLIEDIGMGSPFLMVDFEQTPPKVKAHEGRGRCKLISELHGKNTPILVHIFPMGGARARHITTKMLSDFYKSIVAEKSSDVVRSPITPFIWYMDKWLNVANLGPQQDAAAFIDVALIKPKTDYQLYTYTGSRALKFPFKRGRTITTYRLEPGDKFGLRKSTSTTATRMYFEKIGINHIFTVSGEMARKLMKAENSKPVGKQSVADKSKSAAVEHVTSIRAALSKATHDPKIKSFFSLPEKSGATWRLLARWMNLHEGVKITGEMLYAYDRMRHLLHADKIGELKNPKPLTHAVVRGAAAIKKVLGRMPKEKELTTVLRYIRSIKKGTRQPKALPELAWHDRKYVWDSDRYRRV